MNLFLDPTAIFTIIVIFLALKNRNAFSEDNPHVSTRQKIWLVIFALICLPVVITSIYIAFNAYYLNHTDYWYKKAVSMVNFHLYEIKPPTGLVIDSIYKTGEKFSPELDGAVQTVISAPLRGQVSGSIPLIIVRQVGVSSDFDLKTFVDKVASASSSRSVLLVSLVSSESNAFLVQTTTNSSSFHPLFLYLITSDNTLVSISTPDQPIETLFQVARSFFSTTSLSPTIVFFHQLPRQHPRHPQLYPNPLRLSFSRQHLALNLFPLELRHLNPVSQVLSLQPTLVGISWL